MTPKRLELIRARQKRLYDVTLTETQVAWVRTDIVELLDALDDKENDYIVLTEDFVKMREQLAARDREIAELKVELANSEAFIDAILESGR